MYQILGYLGIIISSYFVVRFILDFRRYRKKISDIVLTPTSEISELLDYRGEKEKIVEVKGMLGTTQTVVSPYTGTECAYYCSIELEKQQKMVYRGYGESRRAYPKVVYKTLSEEKSSHPFYVEDKTGLITVDPEGFELEGRVVLEEETPVETLSLMESIRPTSTEDRTISKIKKEIVLMPEERVYIIGELFVGEKSNFIGSDPFKNKTSLISVNEEYKIVRKYAGVAARRLLGAVALVVVVVVLIRSLV
jgi:hypothetical protein